MYVRSNPELAGIMTDDRIACSNWSSPGCYWYYSSFRAIFILSESAFRLSTCTKDQSRYSETVPDLKVYICLTHPESYSLHTFPFQKFLLLWL